MNPAKELLEIVKKWDALSERDSITSRRSGSSTNSPTMLWENQARASQLFHQVIDFIRTQDEPEEWQAFINDTWNYLYQPNNSWGTAPMQGTRAPSNVKTGLIGLSMTMGATGFSASTISSEQVSSLVETLEEVKEQLRMLPQTYREFIDDVVFKIDWCLDILNSENLSGSKLREAREKSFEIVGESVSVIHLLPSENRKKFFANLMSISGAWVGGVFQGITSDMISQSIFQAITQ